MGRYLHPISPHYVTKYFILGALHSRDISGSMSKVLLVFSGLGQLTNTRRRAGDGSHPQSATVAAAQSTR